MSAYQTRLTPCVRKRKLFQIPTVMQQNIRAQALGSLLLLFSVAAATLRLPSAAAQSKSPGPSGTRLTVEVLAPTGSVKLQKYTEQLADRMRQNWFAVMPEEVFTGASGTVGVVFHILPNGSIPDDEPKIESSSKREALDKAAVEAVRNSAPFTALPARFRGSGVKLRCDFVYNMHLGSLRKHQYDANPDGTPRLMPLTQPDN
jgi:TonB family protein